MAAAAQKWRRYRNGMWQRHNITGESVASGIAALIAWHEASISGMGVTAATWRHGIISNQ